MRERRKAECALLLLASGAGCARVAAPRQAIGRASESDHFVDPTHNAATCTERLEALRVGEAPVEASSDDMAGVVLEGLAPVSESVRIAGFSRRSGAVHIQVIELHPRCFWGFGAELTSGVTTEAAFDIAVAASRRALLTPQPDAPSPLAEAPHGEAPSWTRRAHLRLRLTDGEGHSVERRISGGEATGNTDAFQWLAAAAAPFETLLASVPLEPSPATPDHRRVFSEGFLSSWRAPGMTAPWVKEEYAWVASELGTSSLLPTLVRIAATEGDAEALREREAAVDAIGWITGWDARSDRGRPRTTEEAVRAIMEECQ